MSKPSIPNPSAFASLNVLKSDLKKQAELEKAKAEKRLADEQAAKLAAQDADAAALFQKATQGIQPIPQEQTVPHISKPIKKALNPTLLARRAAAIGTDGASIDGISDTKALLNPIASEAILSFREKTLQHRVFDQLKSGNLRWVHAVDLHGCTTEQARAAVLEIIRMAQADPEALSPNVIKIIHGKGIEATLKTYVNSWLRQHPEVMGFVSAPVAQGGTGAVLVLLKRGER
ncbi:Smr/MutS family protein [Aquirhabdus parva]|uniref:DNA mismatch repair protein MutS n=1 Tax=Aquirhabdus parva TaxID=2283318 RepID=A0A345P511_9GAMM|nr:Smr/MutS family protein [Aquirhabdus parva]AXI02370.1 DNA mismatch repair protein MutS [Aquirhabdus parva]